MNPIAWGMALLIFVTMLLMSLQQTTSSRAGCLRSTTDRFEHVVVLRAQATGDEAVAADPQQPTRTKDARTVQATIERASAESLMTRTRPTERERRAYCADAFPLLFVF